MTEFVCKCCGYTVFEESGLSNNGLCKICEWDNAPPDKKIINKNEIEICPECGGKLAHQEGCVTCPRCGWSICQ